MALSPVRFSPSYLWNFCQQLNDRYLVASLLVLGLLLRLPSLRLGLWRDEGSTYFDVIPSSLTEVIKTVIRCELNPPGFFLIMHQWMHWFGAGEIVLKILPLLFGLLLIVATYELGCVVKSRITGLIAAAITTITPTTVYYSQEARPYTLAALLCCLVVLMYCKAVESEHKQRYLLGFVLFGCLLTYAQYTGLLVLIILALVTVYLLWRREPGVKLVPFAFAFGAIFLLFTPWLPIFLTHLHIGTPWSEKAPWLLRSRLFLDCIAFTIPVERLRSLITFPVILVLGIGAVRLFYHPKKYLPQMIVLAAIVGLLAVIEAALSNNGDGRYMFVATPVAYVLYSSWALNLRQYLNQRISRHSRRSVLQLALVLVLLFWIVFPNMLQALSLGSLAKSGVRTLVANLETWHLERPLYLVAPDYLGPTFGYYFASVHPVTFYGFARWNHPEIFTPQGYGELWRSPTVVTDAHRRIQDEIQKGYRWLCLIKDTTPAFSVALSSQIENLLSELKQTYPLQLKVDYPSSHYMNTESVTLYLFAIKPHSSIPVSSPKSDK
jgi:hypothetical protein